MAKIETDAIIFLTPTYIGYFNMNPEQDAQFIYPEGTVAYQEVITADVLAIALQTFLKANNFQPGRVIMLLSDSLVYHEAVSGTDVAQQNALMESFFSYVPVSTENMARHVFAYKGTTHFIALDKRLLLLVKKTFEDAGFQIMIIAPVSVYASIQYDQLNRQTIPNVLEDEELLVKSNLPFGTKLELKKFDKKVLQREFTKEKETQTDKKKIGVLVVCLICFYVVTSYALISSGILGSPAPRKVASISEHRTTTPSVPTYTPAPSVPPTIAYKAKQLLTITINRAGSNASDSALVKTVLEKNGFANITVSEGQTDANTGIKILTSQNVSPDIKTQLSTLLNPSFQNIQMADAPREATVDIIIYTQ